MNTIPHLQRYLPHKIETKFYATKLYRSGCSISFVCRRLYTVLFDFLSLDCVDFNFYTDGKMDGTVNISIELYDTDNNQYLSDSIEGFLIVKGDVLHKVNLKYYLENKQKMSLWEKLKYWIKK